MSSTARTVLAVVGVVVAGGLLVTGGMRIAERQQTTAQINELREELYRARVSSDRCRSTLASSESALRDLGVTIGDMRRRVDGYEIAEGQVAGSEYEEYMQAFEAYNDSVAVYEVREERLRSNEVTCRATIEEHNALSDSLQSVLAEAGIEAG